jgi:hypothetical protein
MTSYPIPTMDCLPEGFQMRAPWMLQQDYTSHCWFVGSLETMVSDTRRHLSTIQRIVALFRRALLDVKNAEDVRAISGKYHYLTHDGFVLLLRTLAISQVDRYKLLCADDLYVTRRDILKVDIIRLLGIWQPPLKSDPTRNILPVIDPVVLAQRFGMHRHALKSFIEAGGWKISVTTTRSELPEWCRPDRFREIWKVAQPTSPGRSIAISGLSV